MSLFSFRKSSKSDIYRKMGFDIDQDGIIERYSREKTNWDIHLGHCRDVILSALDYYKPATVAILGSGWLLDVPLEEMLLKCKHIYLIDIRHPNQIKHKLCKQKSVTFIEEDITGGMAEQVWLMVENFKKDNKPFEFNKIIAEEFVLPREIEMVVSLKILNQLDILMCDYISSNVPITEEELKNVRLLIQNKHLEMLSKYNYCLISDVEEIVADFNESSKEQKTTVLSPLPQLNHTSEWDWEFDTQGYYYTDKKVKFKVKAIY